MTFGLFSTNQKSGVKLCRGYELRPKKSFMGLVGLVGLIGLIGLVGLIGSVGLVGLMIFPGM